MIPTPTGSSNGKLPGEQFVAVPIPGGAASPYLYSRRSGLFADLQCARAWATARTKAHAEYLEKMGFAHEDGDTYTKDLRPLHAPDRG